MQCEFIQMTDCLLRREDIHRIVDLTFEKTSSDYLQEKTLQLSIVAVDNTEIQKLNLAYRGKDIPTDVLSFPGYDMENNGIMPAQGENIFLGEVVFSQEFIEENSHGSEEEVRRELIFIIAHGILHLLGYEHGEKMFGIQDAVCEDFNIL